jgi:hypothetical protein
LEGHQGQVLTVNFSPAGSTLASVGRDGRIRVWDSASSKELSCFRVPEAEVFNAALSPDGNTVATAGIYYDHLVRVCSVATGKELGRLEHPDSITRLAFSPDGKTLATGCDDNGVYYWEVATGKKIRVFLGHKKNDHRRVAPGIASLVFSPDGKLLASAGRDDTIRLWSVATGEERFRLSGHKRAICTLAFSPDGHTLASGAQDDTIRLWETATGKEYCRLDVWGRCLAFSKDGKLLASGGSDNLIHLWDLGTLREVRQFGGHLGPISSLAFSPDGKTLASGSEDTTVLVWDLIGSIPQGSSGARTVQAPDLEVWWTDLSSEDVSKAYKSLWAQVQARDQAVHFVKTKVKPVPTPDPRKVAGLLADLDNNQFIVREKASAELERLGELAEESLRMALMNKPSAEFRRRAEQLMAKLEKPVTDLNELRAIRAVEVLEKIGTTEAREVLKSLSQGASSARLTREAKQALDRLDRLPPRK